MTVYAIGDKRPALPADGSFYIAPGARVIGDVRMAENVSIWFNAVLRADNDTMTIGAGSNVQDNCVCHVDPGFPLVIGEDVTVGHSAILHGCSIGDGSLVGMGAVVLNGAKIGKGCLIGAKALVTEGADIPDYSMVLGAPGKVVKTLTPEVVAKLRDSSMSYKTKIAPYGEGLVEV
ncbi:gamma carbonic anhydrase family protein [Rhodobacteraceae bacterium NNCM2]|nr:gamma carbonic anhydrase family protein [Coraliihabitans acroporae]